MARQTRPVHIQVLARGDYIDVEGFGDCKILKADTCLSENLDVACIWAVTPRSQLINVCTSPEALVSLVELVTDDNPDVEETTQMVLPIALRRGDTFYFGRIRVTSLDSGIKHPDEIRFITDSGMTHRIRVRPTMRLRRVVTTRKAKPLSFSEFALSTYDRALERLAEAVLSRTVSRESVEVEDSDVITTKDVPAPVESEKPVLCTDIIDELVLARLHYGDLPVTFVNPEDGYRRANVCGTMIESVYPHGVTTWGAQTWDTKPQPGAPVERASVVSLW